jgi:hypothetical protein
MKKAAIESSWVEGGVQMKREYLHIQNSQRILVNGTLLTYYC